MTEPTYNHIAKSKTNNCLIYYNNGVKFESLAVQTRLDGSGNRNMIFAQ
jgi:hypothetical protein